jgi:signal transduction histidine kinase
MCFFYLRGNDYERDFFLIQLTPLGNATIAFLVTYSIAGQLLLLHACFTASSRSQRRQARWLLLGIAAGTLPQAIFTTIPKIEHFSIPYVRFSAYTLCLIPICYVVAIVRHRLMNIELIINRSVVYTLVSGFALGIYLLSIQGLAMFFHTAARSRAVTAVSVLIAAVLFTPAKARIQRLIDRAFDREAYNYRQTLLTLSQTLHSILDLEILVDTLLRQVTEAMYISRGVVMYRVSGSESTFVPEAAVGMNPLPEDLALSLSPSFAELLKNADRPLDFSDQPLNRDWMQLSIADKKITQEVEAFTRFLRAAVWIPFVTRTKEQENLVGLLVLGQRRSEELYTQADLALLGTLAHQGATAVENATLYAELRARTKAMEIAREQLMATYLDTYGGPVNGRVGGRVMTKDFEWASEQVDGRSHPQSSDLISDFNNIAVALKESHDRLKQLDRLKSQFLDNVSHELRTPLTHIKGFVENLLDGVGGELSEKQRRYLMRIKENCDRLIRLINDLLDLSRIESGKISLQLKPTQLYPILEQAIAGVQPMSEKKRIQISLNCNASATAWVDSDKLGQIMTNLLDNAVKYTAEEGRVNVAVKTLSEQETQICVEDTGIGIAQTELERIFDRFHRASDTQGGVGGIGLGLAIVKNLVEAHGGKIWAESQLGKGSRFYVTLRRKK